MSICEVFLKLKICARLGLGFRTIGVLEGSAGGLAVAKVAMRKARAAVVDETHFEKF